MSKFYVSGKYRGIDVGIVVESENQWQAAVDFVPKVINLLCGEEVMSPRIERQKLKIEEVEEVQDGDY